jgi:hypothetical protein
MKLSQMLHQERYCGISNHDSTNFGPYHVP